MRRDCSHQDENGRFCRVCGGRILPPFRRHWTIEKRPFAFVLMGVGVTALLYVILAVFMPMFTNTRSAFHEDQGLMGLALLTALGCGVVHYSLLFGNEAYYNLMKGLPSYRMTIIDFVALAGVVLGGIEVAEFVWTTDVEIGVRLVFLGFFGFGGCVGYFVGVYMEKMDVQ